MYKNFNLTEEERKEIMESHESHGYKKPIRNDGFFLLSKSKFLFKFYIYIL
jgi:hypothetical protein